MSITEFREIIKSVYDAVNGGLDVNIQSQTSALFQYYMMNEIKTDITLTSDASIGDETVNVSAGHGFVTDAVSPGERIVLWENSRFCQLIVTAVSTNTLTLEEPLACDFTSANAQVVRGNISMNVNGSVTPVDFKLQLRNFTIPIDIGTVIITMQSGATAPDDGTFGGKAALTNGVFFRKEDSVTFSLGNYKSNQDFIDNGGDVTYSDSAPSGTYATRINFDIENIFGQVIRIDPNNNDYIFSEVRDNISGLDRFTVSFIGSYTSGE